MSSKLKLKSNAGGSVSLIVDDALSSDEEFNVSDSGIESEVATFHYATKFPDGTMIIGGTSTLQSITDNGSGTSYFSAEHMFNFPMSFVGRPVVSFSTVDPGGGSYPWAKAGVYRSTTQASAYLQSTVLNATATLQYIAIGRWK